MKKGFTLVELLAVIALLAVIIGFATPAVMNRINSERGKITGALNTTITSAANLYFRNNKSKYSDNSIHYVKLKTLVENDLLDKNILDDYTNYCVKATYENNQYNFEVVSTCVEG